MLQRLYVHNFRCFENFEFAPKGDFASLLMGKNGSGKSAIRHVLAIFQSIGRGQTRVDKLIDASDFAQGPLPMHFELAVLLEGRSFIYTLALESPVLAGELRVLEERLSVDGEFVLNRNISSATIHQQSRETGVPIALLALPTIQASVTGADHPSLTAWMADTVLLAPAPQDMAGQSSGGDVYLNEKASNLIDWLANLIERHPPAYSSIVEHLRQVMPDLASFQFKEQGRDAKTLTVRFSRDCQCFELPLSALSDGEKCFFLGAALLTANRIGVVTFAFWEAPDNFLAAHDIQAFIFALKRSFLRNKGQLIVTSHNPQTILCFTDDSTWVFGRKNHFEPSFARRLEDLQPVSDMLQTSLMQRVLEGELEPW